MEYNLDSFDYPLPEELIAQTPPSKRGESRLLVALNPDYLISPFKDVLSYLDERDVLVVNVSRVIKSRIFAVCERTGKKHEMLFVQRNPDSSWKAMLFNAKKINENDLLILDEDCKVRLLKKEMHLNHVSLEGNKDLMTVLEEKGLIPLPPYIARPNKQHTAEDAVRYQTVYSKDKGSCAAPTAGLHFTDEMIASIKNKGIEIKEVLLHVGPGTFLPVKTQDIREHTMHSEWIEITPETADALNTALGRKKRIVCVGTTSLRSLESCFKDGRISPFKGFTDIFIHPPRIIQSADRLITNFHQPKSTLMMLVSAFSGNAFIKEAYAYAIENKMRFLSYGDALLLQNQFKSN